MGTEGAPIISLACQVTDFDDAPLPSSSSFKTFPAWASLGLVISSHCSLFRDQWAAQFVPSFPVNTVAVPTRGKAFLGDNTELVSGFLLGTGGEWNCLSVRAHCHVAKPKLDSQDVNCPPHCSLPLLCSFQASSHSKRNRSRISLVVQAEGFNFQCRGHGFHPWSGN